MADPTNPEDTAAAFAALNETLRQFQDTLGSSLDSLSTSMNAAARASATAARDAAARDTAAAAAAAAERTERAAEAAATREHIERTKSLNEEIARAKAAYGDAAELQIDLTAALGSQVTVLTRLESQQKRELELNEALLAQGKARGELNASSTAADKEAFLLREKENAQKKKSEKILEDELKQMGKMLDVDGKIVKITKELLTEDEKKLAQAKKQHSAEEASENAQKELAQSLKNLKNDLITLGLTTTFDFLKASIIGTYKAQVAYEDALIAGERGRSVEAAAINARMQEMAGALDGLGGGLVNMGAQLATTALNVALLGGPISLLAIAIAGLLAVFGYSAKVEAENMKRTAELKKKQAELFDTLFKDFGALGEASMTGARGMMGLKDDLAAVGLSIKEFEKLNKVLSANSKEIAMFGASTVNGAKSFIEVTGGLINSELSKTFETMGITQEAQIAHAEKYMAMESRFGTLQEKSLKDQIKAAGQYVVELDKMAALTGATRKEQEQAREAVMAIAQLRAALFEAKERAKTGDPEAKAKVEELERAVKVSTTLMNAGQKDLAMGVAQYSASGGPNTEAAARAMQVLPQVLESIKSGKGTDVTRTQEISSDLKKFLGQYAGTMKYTGAIAGLYQDSLGEADDFITRMEGMEKAKREFESKPENKGKEFDPDKYLEEVRKNKDKETNTQVDIERANREKALAIQEKILNGQELASQEMTNATSDFWKGVSKFMDGVVQFMKAVLEFAKHPIDSVKEFFTGKDKSQRDAEELQEVSKRIEGLKKALGNPDEAKKLADDNLALAKKEFDAKDKAVTELNIAYNKERDINKRKEIEQKQILAEDEREAARRKKVMAETAVTDAAKAKRDNNPEKIKKQLEGLETRKKELTESVNSNGPSKTTPAARDAAAAAPATPQSENDKAATRNKRQGAPTQTYDTAPEAPKKELGGIVPGTIDGTTVTVGEKGKPEAIMPLDMLKPGMLQNAEKSKDPNADAMLLLFKSLSSQTADAFAMFNRIVSEAESAKKNNTKEWQALPKDIQESITKSIADYKSTIPDIAKQIAGQKQQMNQIDADPKLKITDPNAAMKNLIKMVDVNDELAGINYKDFEISVKQFDQSKIDSNLTELSNRLTEKQTSIIDDKLIKSMNAETETNNKLILSMNKVTEMLPTTVQKIIDAAAAPTSGGSAAAPTSGGGASPAGGGSAAAPTSGGGASPAGGSSGKPGESVMAKSGAAGEVQSGPSVNTGKEIHTGGTVSWRTNNPGNVSYGDLAKQYGAIGTWKNPDGDQQQRTTGIAIMPSLEDGDKLKMALWKRPMYIDKTIDQGVAQWTGTTGLGSAYAKDLANAAGASVETKIRELSESQLLAMVTKQRQWEGFKPGKVEPVKAFDGGVFEPKPGGVHVNLAEAGLREAAVPLNPGEKIRVEKSEEANNPPKKDPLSTVLASDSSAGSAKDHSAEILAALHDLMEEKFNTMISTLRDGNDITDKLLKYSQV